MSLCANFQQTQNTFNANSMYLAYSAFTNQMILKETVLAQTAGGIIVQHDGCSFFLLLTAILNANKKE